MLVKAKVIIVDSFGAIVQFASGVKALCPLRHMSELEIVKPRKKFQVMWTTYYFVKIFPMLYIVIVNIKFIVIIIIIIKVKPSHTVYYAHVCIVLTNFYLHILINSDWC